MTEKQKLYNRNYRERNKEEIKRKRKIYEQENKDAISEQRRQYRLKNKDSIRESKRVYRNNNREKVKLQKKRWKTKNPDNVRLWKKNHYYRKKAKKKILSELGVPTLTTLKRKQTTKCNLSDTYLQILAEKGITPIYK